MLHNNLRITVPRRIFLGLAVYMDFWKKLGLKTLMLSNMYTCNQIAYQHGACVSSSEKLSDIYQITV